ncbi:hypothetical protein [Bradyrhizobium sp.]|uniref:hypothetical protein n=1 Tax=Bradyrhizobium sp. TaxID=376 RepID=UPI003C37D392
MNRRLHSLIGVAALVATVECAQAATAGHMLKSTPPAGTTDITGSISKPAATAKGTKGATKKHHAQSSGTNHSDVTGSIKPTSSSGQ